jgi:hypothetical protein
MGTLRTTEIFADASFRLIAVESIEFGHSKTNRGCRLVGNLQPVAVIVCAPEGSYALDMDAKPIAIEQLKRELPGLDIAISPSK